MIGRHRIGALGMMALALGAVPLPQPKHRPVDMAAAELLIHELQQNGLDPLAIAERAGAEGFVELGRAVLAMRQTHRALGNEMTTLQLIAEVDALARPADMGRIDLQPMYDLGARRVTIGDERGVPLAHVTLREGAKTLHPRDVLSMRPVLGNRIPGPRMDVAAAIASEAMGRARAPTPAKEPRDRSAKRPEQAQARAAKSRRKARKGWA